jgi:hypothetical protein
MNEAQIQSEIRITLGRIPDLRMFRNNVGVAQVRGTHIRYGLAKGSADLIGWLALKPPLVPYPIARFMSLEIKTETGKPTEEQKMWMEMVQRFGGFACIVRSPKEALAAVERARNGASN